VRRRRARSPEDKAARKQAVLDEAWRLFQRGPWSALTLAQVAEGVGLSKAALYRYFDTKETLFLAVEESQLTLWPMPSPPRWRRARRWPGFWRSCTSSWSKT